MSAAPPHSGNVGSVPHKHHSNPPMQGSFAVPRYRPSVMYVPNTSVATGVPTIQHFNSRGELINHRRIRPTVIDLRKPQPQIQEQPHRRLPQGGRSCRQCGVSFVSSEPQDLCTSCQHRITAATTKKVANPNISNDADMKVVETKILVQGESVPKSPSHVDSDPQYKSTDDIVMDDLELVYPEQTEGGNSCGGVSCADADVQMREILKLEDVPSDQQVNTPEKTTPSPHAPSNPRRKARVVGSVHDQPGQGRSPRTVSSPLKDPLRARNQSLKLCSSENCTGIISANSLATRCLQCVKNDWKFLKDMRNVTRDDSAQTSTSRIPSEGWSNSESTVAKRKGVTWADQVDNDAERQSASTRSSLFVKIPKTRETLQASPPLVSSPTPLSSKNLGSDLPSKEPLETLSAGLPPAQAPREDPALSPKESPARSPEKLPRVRLLLNKPKERSASSESYPAMSPLRPQASQSTTMNVYSGWESDLTELSETTDDASTSDAESSSDLSGSSESESPGPSLPLPEVKLGLEALLSPSVLAQDATIYSRWDTSGSPVFCVELGIGNINDEDIMSNLAICDLTKS
ncbi:hypothetical protein D9619_000824 [Psilocybe cf. subviscida]|uniref:Uncharacterized protein n=1 Tax=Psilocybe cf. subviscida TaxID=2480587 RepID=A0A8H5BFQ2_9AGAR|nr:hypothetical protein D9619_000824 [Psilocybe cf. subviscida]